MTLVEMVQEKHVVTEAACGLCCFTCSTEANEAVAYPCPTLLRAYELENISPTGA